MMQMFSQMQAAVTAMQQMSGNTFSNIENDTETSTESAKEEAGQQMPSLDASQMPSDIKDALDFKMIKEAYDYKSWKKGARQIKYRIYKDYGIVMNLKRLED